MKDLNTFISKETCLLYGLPGTAILAVSLILSCKVGNDFGGSVFVSAVTFVVVNVLLWMLYLTLFQHLPVDLMRIWLSKRNHAGIEAAETITSKGAEDSPATAIQPIDTAEYQRHCAEFERKKQEEHQNLVKPIMDYAGRMMAPFMEEDELDRLRDEIRAWCDNPDHEPQPVRMKPTHDNKDRLKTVSFKHFIWNIAARLGFENGYSVKVQARFIKALFPKELADIETTSLERSLTSSPDAGHIKLDRPKHTDNYAFHF